MDYRTIVCLIFCWYNYYSPPLLAQAPTDWVRVSVAKDHSVPKLAADDQRLVAAIYGIGVGIKKKGSEWVVRLPSADDFSVTAVALHGKTIFAGTRNEGLYRSDDGGNTWIKCELPARQGAVHTIYVWQGRVYVGTGSGLLVYEPAENACREIELVAGEDWVPVFSMVGNEDHLFLGSRGLVFYGTPNTQFTETEEFTSTDVLSLILHKNFLLAATGGENVFKANLNNLQWTPFGQRSKASIRNVLYVDNNKILKGANGQGILEDNLEAGGTLGSQEVISLLRFEGKLYAGTRSDGLYVEELMDNKLFKLYQGRDQVVTEDLRIFPNPASAFVSVDYRGETFALNRLMVVNSLGQLVVERPLEFGINNIDTSRLPDGSYRILLSSTQTTISATFLVQH